jgi:hypothetical protein
METKLSKLKAAYASGDIRSALRIASRFPSLGQHKEAITRAWAAIQNPDFYRQLGQDTQAHIDAGIVALRERYSL